MSTSTEDHPLVGYAAIAGAYAAGVGGALALARRTGHELPERLGARDLALLAVATQQGSRLIARDEVTRFVREPFTEVVADADAPPSELSERPRRNQGEARHAIGELISCTLCVDMWVAAAAVVGITVAPRATRTVATLLAIKGAADVLQLAYARFARG